ncbi:MAG: hypothetical protein NDJ72_03410, partial [Elusimicrobia bacterium]|nr:hypothetical protein [Elusimicrobiota bacterium]
MSLRLGLDFDNTVIRYDAVFARLARRRGWLKGRPAATKDAVKALLLAEDGHDLRWQALQAEAYGREILSATFFPGCLDFLRRAKAAGHEVFIVSHKSKTSHFDPSVKLREAALLWLKRRAKGLIAPANVRFAADRAEKVRMIAHLDLDLFVDDLPEVLEHPAFPKDTARLHFSARPSRLPRAARWSEVRAAVDDMAALGPAAYRAVERTTGERPARVERGARQGNNRPLKVTLASGAKLLVKRYLVDARDRRERGRVEFRALTLLWDNGIRRIPQPLYLDPNGEFALLSWIDGRDLRKKGAGRAQVLQAAAFIKRLAGLRPGSYPEAADSRRCLGDYARHIERRLSRVREGAAELKGFPQARRFVAETVVPLKERLLARFFVETDLQGLDLEAPLPASQRILSPSDFGFHNALEDAKGRMHFLDFEYFGQDDPAKLACDFSHHVAQSVSPENRRRFVSQLAASLPDHELFLRRVDLVYDLVGLEWLLIVLNVFAPETRARRRFADPGVSENALLKKRLAVARRLAAALEREHRP